MEDSTQTYSNEKLLLVDDLRTSFFTKKGEIKAVDGVSFSVAKGEILGLVGESGSGKSITCLSILGLVPQPAGKVLGGRILFKNENLLEKSIIPPLGPNEWGGKEEYPVYERISSFEKGLRLDGTYEGTLDPFPWKYSGNGAEWDKTFGRTDTFSLKIDKKDTGLTRWNTFQGDGEGYFAEPWTPCKGYRVSCYVKTDSVTGRGSTVALQYHIPNSAQKYPIVTAKKVTGTKDWTRLEIEVGPPAPSPPEIGCIMIILQQDGSGTTWFDDLKVELIQ